MDRIIILRIKYSACEICSVINTLAVACGGAVTALTDGVSGWTDVKDEKLMYVSMYVCIYFADK